MTALNTEQVYSNNPATTFNYYDLFYFSQNSSTDAAIAFGDFYNNFPWVLLGGFQSGSTAIVGPNGANGLPDGGQYSVCWGRYFTANLDDSLAVGEYIAIGDGSYILAVGNDITNPGDATQAYAVIGAGNAIGADYSLTVGSGNTNYGCLAIGQNNTVGSGSSWSVAIGNGHSITNAQFAFAYGLDNNIASGANSAFAIGTGAIVNNPGSLVWGDSNEDPPQDTAANQYNLCFAGGYFYYTNNTPTLNYSFDANGNFTSSGGRADNSASYQNLSSGFNVTFPDNTTRLVLTNSSLVATGTVTLPATPFGGQVCIVSSAGGVTSLTVNGNGNTVIGAPSIIHASTGFAMIYSSNDTAWYPTI